MASISSLVNTFNSGMDMDTDVAYLSSDAYRYAENVRIISNDGGTKGVLQNIEGVRPYDFNLPKNETILGVTTIDKYAVIITKIKHKTLNKVYRVEGFHTDDPTYKVILKGDFGLCSDDKHTLSLVGNYESDNNIKIYFTDGTSSIKVLNIFSDKYEEGTTSGLVDNDGYILNKYALDITPGAQLPPFNIAGIYAGSLPTGVV